MPRTIKTTIALDGEAKFRTALKRIDSELNVLSSEMRKTTAEYGQNNTSVEALTAKNDVLGRQMAQQREKVKVLTGAVSDSEKAYAQAVETAKSMAEQYGENSKEAIKAGDAVQRAEKTMDKYRTQLNSSQASLYNTERRFDELAQTVQNLHTENIESTARATETLTQKDPSTLKDKFKNFGSAVQKTCSATAVSVEALAKGFTALAKAGAKVAETGIKAVTKEIEIGTKAFAGYLTAVGSVTAGIGSFAISSGKDFETSMSNVQGISGATGSDLKKLEDAAKEMGRTTSKSAAESADALGYMALAGWDTTQMLEGLEPILRASEAGNMDLATCSDLVTDSMSALGVKTSELTGYLDIVSKAQSSSNTTMQGLLEAYIVCGGTMKNLNIPLEESASLLGVLANRGIKSSEAGTSLNSILVNLIGANKRATTAMTSLGVSAWDADGNFIGVKKTLALLNDALADCTDEQKALFQAQIGGKTQMDTLQALLSGVGEEYDDLHEKLSDCDGAMLTTAKTMQDNVNGAFVTLKSAAEGFGIAIYDNIKGYLKETLLEASGWVTKFSNAIGNTSKINTLIGQLSDEIVTKFKKIVPTIVSSITDFTSIFNTAVLAGLKRMISVLPTVTTQILPPLRKGFFSLINSVISLLPTLAPELAKAGAEFFSRLVYGINSAAMQLSFVVPQIIDDICTIISEKAYSVLGSGTMIIEYLISGILSSIQSLSDCITTCISAIVECILARLINFTDGGLQIIQALVDGIIEALPDIIDTISYIIERMVTSITEYFPTLVRSGIEILQALLDGIANTLPTIIPLITDCIMSIVDTVMDNLPLILDTGVKILLMLINGIIDKLPDLIDTAVDLVLTICDTLLDNLSEILAAALRIVMALCQGIVNNLDKIFQYIPQVVEAIVTAIIDNLDLLIQAAIEILIALGSGLISCIGELLSFTPQIVDAIVNSLINNDWAATGRNIMSGIFNGILEMGNQAGEMLSNACENIVFAFKSFFGIQSPSKLMKKEVGKYLALGVGVGFTEEMKKVSDSMSEAVPTSFDTAVSAHTVVSGSTAGQTGAGVSNVYISFGNVTINSDDDIQSLAYKLEFNRRQAEMAIGR